ncbi:MAG: hypothetical protein FXF47_03770 [Candidatus Mcinerneyibacterium aminivorans]|uniref:Uncharacterized protein n=1 Tax=Candidatus Mcinerneyibacterium aminivorans TaxID=2703815 RepID=A0A5D0MGA8_9BACT|nr:MAG: hypothetical protein FXF47_03770 [Candidatus Mcinerneyibacterium aminivorans]
MVKIKSIKAKKYSQYFPDLRKYIFQKKIDSERKKYTRKKYKIFRSKFLGRNISMKKLERKAIKNE